MDVISGSMALRHRWKDANKQRCGLFKKHPAKLLNCWHNIIVGRLKEIGYMYMWSTWIIHSLSSSHNLERLQIVNADIHVSIKFNLQQLWILCNYYGKSLALLKPRDSAQRPRLKPSLCICWNWLLLLTNIVSTITRQRIAAGLYLYKITLVTTWRIKRKTYLYFEFRRSPLLTV